MEVLVLLGFVVWVCSGFGAWAASLAEKRGRPIGPHVALGVLLGPVGVLLTALRSHDHEALSDR